MKNIFYKTIVYFYRSRSKALYFWDLPRKTEKEIAKKARAIAITDILSIALVGLTIFIALLLRAGIIPKFSLAQYSHARMIILVSLFVLIYLIGSKLDPYVKKIIEKESGVIDWSQYNKRKTLKNFLLLIFGPLLYLIFYVGVLKLLTFLF